MLNHKATSMAKSRKLLMKKRETKKQISVSFTKRRHGLFNKAADLFMLCDAHLAVLVSSPSTKPKRKFYSFGYPSVADVLDPFLLNCHPSPIDHQEAKRHAHNLLSEIDSFESQSILRQDFYSNFKIFENSKSIEELQKLVRAVGKLIDKVKSRLRNDVNENSLNSALININHGLFDTCLTSNLNYDSYTVFPTLQSASPNEFKNNYGNVVNDVMPDLNVLNSYNRETKDSRQDDNWSLNNKYPTCSSLSDVTVELNRNEFGLESNAVATLEMAPQPQELLINASEIEDPIFVDDWLWF